MRPGGLGALLRKVLPAYSNRHDPALRHRFAAIDALCAAARANWLSTRGQANLLQEIISALLNRSGPGFPFDCAGPLIVT
jgi:hypothetical protein